MLLWQEKWCKPLYFLKFIAHILCNHWSLSGSMCAVHFFHQIHTILMIHTKFICSFMKNLQFSSFFVGQWALSQQQKLRMERNHESFVSIISFDCQHFECVVELFCTSHNISIHLIMLLILLGMDAQRTLQLHFAHNQLIYIYKKINVHM